MKKKQFALTLDLESDHSGIIPKEYRIFQEPEKIRELLEMLREEDVKLSVFVVGEVLEQYPEIIELFREYGTEFHGHSYSHIPEESDSAEEVKNCRLAYEKYFNKPPVGYRAPLGIISDQGIKNLQKEGFKFDASIFPSYRPNPFKYMLAEKSTHIYKGSDIVEIPNSTVSPFLITLSISYVKLLGFGLYRFLMSLWKLNDTLVFGCHLHDFFSARDTVAKLPGFWKFVYSRNHGKGIDYTRKLIRLFKKKGYDFVHMSEIYENFINKSEVG